MRSTVFCGSTSPSYGQPNTVETYARTGTFAAAAIGMTSLKAAIVSAIVLLTFFLLCVSDADKKTAISFMPDASAVSRPRRFGTSALMRTPAGRATPRATSAASASCGIHFGDTKLVISIARMPAATSESMKRILSAVGTLRASFCRPSRGPTS